MTDTKEEDHYVSKSSVYHVDVRKHGSALLHIQLSVDEKVFFGCMEIPYPENSNRVLSDSIFGMEIPGCRFYRKAVSCFLEQRLSFSGI